MLVHEELSNRIGLQSVRSKSSNSDSYPFSEVSDNAVTKYLPSDLLSDIFPWTSHVSALHTYRDNDKLFLDRFSRIFA